MSQTKAQLISDLVQALNFTGTASAPANGVFLSATNTLAFATNSGSRITIDSSGNLNIPNDSGKLRFGTGNDLEIYHSGSASIINNSTGVLIQRSDTGINLRSDALNLKKGDDSEFYLKCTANGAVELYHDNSKKFETKSTGVIITGNDASGSENLGSFFFKTESGTVRGHFDTSNDRFGLKDNVLAAYGNSNDLQIYHDGSNSYIAEGNVGNLIISSNIVQLQNAAQDENLARFIQNGSVELYHDSSKKFETTINGISVTGSIIPTGNVNLGDSSSSNNNRFIAGASDDLQIYHDGSNSYIKNTTGNLVIRSDNRIDFQDAAGNESFAAFIDNGAVELYHDGSKKFETQSIGITVTGQVACDELNMADSTGAGNNRIKLGASDDLQIFHNGTDAVIVNNTGDLYIENDSSSTDRKVFIRPKAGEASINCFPDGAVDLYYDNALQVSTASFGLHIAGEQKILFKKESSTSGSVIAIDFDKNNPTNNVGDISYSNSAVTYNTGSDYRLKENERPIDDAIEKVKLLKPYYFNFIETPEILSQGFYAHEVSDVVPTAVKGEKDQVALNGMPIYQKLDHSKIVPMLAAGLKALIEKVETLEAALESS